MQGEEGDKASLFSFHRQSERRRDGGGCGGGWATLKCFARALALPSFVAACVSGVRESHRQSLGPTSCSSSISAFNQLHCKSVGQQVSAVNTCWCRSTAGLVFRALIVSTEF